MKERPYTTDAGESLCGIALRQLGNENRWTEIRDLNADRFPDMLGADYYPVGTTIKIPAPDASMSDSFHVQLLRRMDAALEQALRAAVDLPVPHTMDHQIRKMRAEVQERITIIRRLGREDATKDQMRKLLWPDRLGRAAADAHCVAKPLQLRETDNGS